MSAVLPILIALGGALGGVLSAVGAWIARGGWKHRANNVHVKITSPDGTTDELRVDETRNISAEQVATWLRDTLEKHLDAPPEGRDVAD